MQWILDNHCGKVKGLKPYGQERHPNHVAVLAPSIQDDIQNMSPFQPLLATAMRRRSKYIYLARSTFWFDSVQSQVLKMTQKDGIQIRYINFLWTSLRRKIKNLKLSFQLCSNILRKSTPFFPYPSTNGIWAPSGSEETEFGFRRP